MKKLLFLSVMFSVLVLSGVKLSSAEEAPALSDPATAAAPEMTAEQKAMGERMQKFGTLNENHELLKKLEGIWNTHGSFWMDAKGDPVSSDGQSVNAVVLNGRYLEQKFTGTAMGQPYEGRGILGYDNLKKAFTTVWYDNMGTGLMTVKGTYDEASKTITFEGSMSCPVTEETERWYKEVLTIVDDHNFRYETYMKDKDGKEFKSMEITYARASEIK